MPANSLTPYLTFKNAEKALRFYEAAFGAKEVMRLKMPDGGTAHAEMLIGDSRVMLGDEAPAWGNKSPESLGGSPAAFMLYVDDVDQAFPIAIRAGATIKRPVADQFYGDRTGTLIDPFGYQWSIGTHKEDVDPAEMQTRMEAMFTSQAASSS